MRIDSLSEEFSPLITKEFANFFRDKRILITGGSGLLGSNFAELFQTYTDTFSGNIDLNLISKTGIFPFKLSRGTSIIQQDLTSSNLPKSIGKFDIIIHCAGYGQPAKFQQNPLKTIHLNTTTTLELSTLLKSKGSFLFMSSSEVYSGLSKPPFSEEDIGTTNTNHSRSSYIESKRTGESIIAAMQSEFPDIHSSAARLALAYGPGAKNGDNRVLYELIKRGLDERKLVLRDSGKAIRTYCYISDAIEHCLHILMRGSEHVYNVGGRSRVSIKELAELIGNILDIPVTIPEDSGDFLSDAPKDVWLDLTKIERLSGKATYVSINEGLLKTISWIKARDSKLEL
jgi:nucleoside-diphosphate-sugar epimerase